MQKERGQRTLAFFVRDSMTALLDYLQTAKKKICLWGAALAQWICLHQPFATLGSSLKHTIYAFFIYSICAILSYEENKKRPGLAHFLKKMFVFVCSSNATGSDPVKHQVIYAVMLPLTK